MARLPRYVLPGQPQHIIQRGNNREEIFHSPHDYQLYLNSLEEAGCQYGCSVHAYVLMTNHVHLLVTPEGETSISQTMQSLGRIYVQYFNYRYARTGTLWEGRFRSTLIDSDAYLLSCYRYVELNPVRAGMVAHPSEYAWSSYKSNGLGEKDALVTPHALYTQLGSDGEARQERYRRLFEADIPPQTLEQIRAATNNAWVLGSDQFRTQVESITKRQASPRARGGDRKSAVYHVGKKINRV